MNNPHIKEEIFAGDLFIPNIYIRVPLYFVLFQDVKVVSKKVVKISPGEILVAIKSVEKPTYKGYSRELSDRLGIPGWVFLKSNGQLFWVPKVQIGSYSFQHLTKVEL